jgi:hypothetical protein
MFWKEMKGGCMVKNKLQARLLVLPEHLSRIHFCGPMDKYGMAQFSRMAIGKQWICIDW